MPFRKIKLNSITIYRWFIIGHNFHSILYLSILSFYHPPNRNETPHNSLTQPRDVVVQTSISKSTKPSTPYEKRTYYITLFLHFPSSVDQQQSGARVPPPPQHGGGELQQSAVKPEPGPSELPPGCAAPRAHRHRLQGLDVRDAVAVPRRRGVLGATLPARPLRAPIERLLDVKGVTHTLPLSLSLSLTLSLSRICLYIRVCVCASMPVCVRRASTPPPARQSVLCLRVLLLLYIYMRVFVRGSLREIFSLVGVGDGASEVW